MQAVGNEKLISMYRWDSLDRVKSINISIISPILNEICKDNNAMITVIRYLNAVSNSELIEILRGVILENLIPVIQEVSNLCGMVCILKNAYDKSIKNIQNELDIINEIVNNTKIKMVE